MWIILFIFVKMVQNKKILIKKFLTMFYGDLSYSPKNLWYYKNNKIYFEYVPKDEIIFINFLLMVKPLLSTFSIDGDDPVMLTELYNVMEEWFEEEYKIIGAIT
jgi:hypothetical protein